MAGIHVLSNLLKPENKAEKTTAFKEKDSVTSPANSATVFATMLNGRMKPNADSKGQNSQAGQDMEKKPSDEDPTPSTQMSNGLGSMQVYGNFVLPFLTQMLQSDHPAGKEANSGNGVSQGTGSLSTANSAATDASVVAVNNLGLDMLNLLSLASNKVSAQLGMTTSKAQGDNPGITELDQYRQVIADLLGALSGKITNVSANGTSVSSDSAGTNNLSQDMAKIVQGWMIATDEVAKDGPVSKDSQVAMDQKGIQSVIDNLITGIGTGNSVMSAKLATLLAALNPKLSQGGEEVGITKASQVMDVAIQAGDGIIDSMAKESSEPMVKQLKGTDLNTTETQVKDIALQTKVLQSSDGTGPLESKNNTKVLPETFRETVQKVDNMKSTPLSGEKDLQNQNSNTAIGVVSNIVVANVADGKTVALPVWEQISTVVREQVLNKSQDLKQLDIQLHPADLGKIQIDLHWENGQVHLQVQASQAATGQLLQNHLTDLRQALANQGVNCGMLQMGQGGERQQNSHRDEARRSSNPSTNHNEDEDLISDITPLSLGQGEINRINVTA